MLNSCCSNNYTNGATLCHVPHQQYPLNSSYYGYQRANKKELYQIIDKEFDDCPKGFYMMLKHKTKDVQYSDKSFDKMDANFVGIELFCKNVKAPFFQKLSCTST